MKEIILPITTNGSGAATVTATHAVLGYLHCIEYRPGTMDTGAGLTVTCETGTTSIPLLVKASAGTSNVWFYPRVLANSNTDGAALTDRTFVVMSGKPKVVVASGGATASGTLILYYEE